MPLATHDDAMREYARNVGDHPDNIGSQWILTGYDVWVVNPWYTGPTQPHPEDDSQYFDDEYYEAVNEPALFDEFPDWVRVENDDMAW